MNQTNNNCGECNCIGDILKNIICMQQKSSIFCDEGGCDRPFLGPNNTDCYNTRPISFYSCCTGEIYTVNGSSIFRLESIDDCCCKCRILNFADGTYTSTNDFFTINLNCVSAIKCYQDINLAI